MPSPFPGMDPYLESPSPWADFHDALATEIRSELNRTLPAPYYARLEMRPEIGIIEEGATRQRIVPDVAIVRPPESRPTQARAATVLDRPRADISRPFEITVHDEPIRHHFVEIRDAARGHRLVTLIEILSPSNKRPGPDRAAYERKQREILESDASLVELDLLRSGERVLPSPELAPVIRQFDPPPDYLVLISRAWQRTDAGLGYQGLPFGLREWLPCIPVPLRPAEPEPPLDLQFLFNRVYEGGPYRRGAIDYSGPPDPPLAEPDASWAAHLVRAQAAPPPE